MSGEQAFDNLANEDLKIWTEGYIAGADAERQQSAALKESLAELIEIADHAFNLAGYCYTDSEYEQYENENKAAIDRAKKLLDKQPNPKATKQS